MSGSRHSYGEAILGDIATYSPVPSEDANYGKALFWDERSVHYFM